MDAKGDCSRIEVKSLSKVARYVLGNICLVCHMDLEPVYTPAAIKGLFLLKDDSLPVMTLNYVHEAKVPSHISGCVAAPSQFY